MFPPRRRQRERERERQRQTATDRDRQRQREAPSKHQVQFQTPDPNSNTVLVSDGTYLSVGYPKSESRTPRPETRNPTRLTPQQAKFFTHPRTLTPKRECDGRRVGNLLPMQLVGVARCAPNDVDHERVGRGDGQQLKLVTIDARLAHHSADPRVHVSAWPGGECVFV